MEHSIISAEALAKLVRLKENTELASVAKIHELLVPFEYTRLDRIIEIAFTVAEDATSALEEEVAGAESTTSDEPSIEGKQRHTSREIIAELRDTILSVLSAEYGPLVKRSRALYWTADKSTRLAITLSKQYEKGNYWYAYHPEWDGFLKEASQGVYVLGCVGRDHAFAIPYAWIHERLDRLNVTEREGGTYWHIHLYPGDQDKLVLRLNDGRNEDLSKFVIRLGRRH